MSLTTILKEGIKVHDELKEFRKANRLAKKSWHEDLCGACAVGSLMLRERLAKQNIETSFIKGLYYPDKTKAKTLTHCWLSKGDLLIDVTATQLNLPLNLLQLGQLQRRRTQVNAYGHLTRFEDLPCHQTTPAAVQFGAGSATAPPKRSVRRRR